MLPLGLVRSCPRSVRLTWVCSLVVVVPAKAMTSRWLVLIGRLGLATSWIVCLARIVAPLSFVVVSISSVLFWLLTVVYRVGAYPGLSTFAFFSFSWVVWEF